MSEDQQHHTTQEKIDSEEFSILMAEIGNSHSDPKDKDRQRELLGAGYRNLNGDPMEEKVRLLARTDWTQIKFMLAEASRMNRVIRTLEEIKDEIKKSRDGRPTNVWDTLVASKKDIRYIAIAACIFPGGAALVSALQKVFGGG